MEKVAVIAFRTDASLQIGSGHVMRCLTLADALRAQGAQCHFISRAHPGHLLATIEQRGYKANSLLAHMEKGQAAIKKIASAAPPNQPPEPAHAAWLGSTWQADAIDTAAVLASLQPDWLVVDHYALDQHWEIALQPHYSKLMVIDDLADRAHVCDVLLDQNLGRQAEDYAKLVPAHCKVLIGPRYALLRPEFAALRAYSLQRRHTTFAIHRLLITMGGVDKDNATGQVLQALRSCSLPADCRITVVMGVTAPWLDEVRKQAQDMPLPTRVLVGVSDMAQLMADSDLAIGAAGSTSWELCCLGVPNLLVCTAANQRTVITALAAACATVKLDRTALNESDCGPFLAQYATLTENLKAYTAAAARVTDGSGVSRVYAELA